MSWRELSAYIEGLHRAGFDVAGPDRAVAEEACLSADGAGEHAAGGYLLPFW